MDANDLRMNMAVRVPFKATYPLDGLPSGVGRVRGWELKHLSGALAWGVVKVSVGCDAEYAPWLKDWRPGRTEMVQEFALDELEPYVAPIQMALEWRE